MANAKVKHATIDLFPEQALDNIVKFIESETHSLSDQTELLYGVTVGDLRKSIESLFYYLSVTDTKLDLPAEFTYIIREE